jgi:hypothetical protein
MSELGSFSDVGSLLQAPGALYTTVSISVGNPGKSYLMRTVILSETKGGLNG